MYDWEVKIWDGEVETSWNVIAENREKAIVKAKKEHFILKHGKPLQISCKKAQIEIVSFI